ncbi:MAG: O-antigen ligase family protein [Desulfobacterales bacterium]|nr:MAG: O-antigen ligase family protein [Desulfobacterales bacterium]
MDGEEASLRTLRHENLSSRTHATGNVLIYPARRASKALTAANGIVFVLLSVFSLWFAGRYDAAFLGVVLLGTARHVISDLARDEKIAGFNYLLLFYILLILISATMHYSALGALGNLAYITVSFKDASWGIETLKSAATVYILLPLLLFLLVHVFYEVGTSQRFLLWLPIMMVPSLLLGLYQGIFDIHFHNSNLGVQLQRVSGLVSDFNGFGISLFLVFPICILGALVGRRWLVRLSFLCLSAAVIGGIFLSGSRTAFLGVTLFGLTVPLIWIWTRQGALRRSPPFFILAVLFVVLLAGAIGGIISQGRSPKSSVLAQRLQASYVKFKENGIAGLAPNRYAMGQQALRLIAASPLSGWGPGGFWRNVDNVRFKNNEKFNYHDNTHNHYLQMSSELGLLGALLNVFFHIWPLYMIYSVRKRIPRGKDRWAVGISFAVVAIMMVLYLTGPHTMLVDVLWIMSAYLAFLIVTALKQGYAFGGVPSRLTAIGSGIITIFFLLGSYDNTFGPNGYSAMQKADWWPLKGQYGFYPPENWSGETMMWTKEKASIRVKASSNLFGFKAAAFPHNSDGAQGLTLKIRLNDRLWDEVNFFNGGVKPLYYYIPSIRGQELELKIEVSRTFNPGRMGLSQDPRDLGVALSPPGFLKIIPQDGIGFYGWKTSSGKQIPEWPADQLLKYRLTGKRASLKIQPKLAHGATFFLKCFHPDIKKRPVEVKILGETGILRQVTFKDNQWKKFLVESYEIKDLKMLTFHVSRTWNPRLLGISEDGRDRGLAVALLEEM